MRIFLQAVLPFLAPTVVFIIWVMLSQRHGHEKSMVERIAGGPWLWLLIGGVVLLAVGVGFMAGGETPGGTYVPPYIEDGKIMPGRIVR